MRQASLFLLTTCLFSTTPGSPTEKARAEALVKDVIAFVKTHGEKAAFHEINRAKGRFHQGELYIFVYDFEGRVLAHGAEVWLVGRNQFHAKDAKGKRYVQERIELAKRHGKGWHHYMFLNPTTHKVEAKSSYIECFRQRIYGCGIYGPFPG